MNFGTLVNRMRLDRGLTREQLARMSGLSTATVYRVETDHQTSHHTETYKLICQALDGNDPLTDKEVQTIAATTGLGPDAIRHEAVRHLRTTRRELGRAKPSADAQRLMSLLEALIDVCESVEEAEHQLRFLVAYKANERGRESVDLTVATKHQPPMAIKRDEKIIDDGLMAETVTIYSKPPPQPTIPDKRQPRRRRAAGE